MNMKADDDGISRFLEPGQPLDGTTVIYGVSPCEVVALQVDYSLDFDGETYPKEIRRAASLWLSTASKVRVPPERDGRNHWSRYDRE